MDLIDPRKTVEVIQQHQFTFSKKFGQNFLIDAHVLDKIIASAGVGTEDVVLEIGPGIGTMTQQLARRAARVIAVEIDDDLIPILRETLAAETDEKTGNVRIINDDIMKIDLCALARKEGGGRPLKVVANLPYYITTPIIMELFESGAPIDTVTVMVQREVAERMKAKPGTKDYGALSLAVQYYAQPYIAAYVPQNCFMPRPKVASAVITLTRYAHPPVRTDDARLMFRLIRAGFNQRRKTLQNALAHDAQLGYTKQDVEAALGRLKLPASVRAEALTLEQFARLADMLADIHEPESAAADGEIRNGDAAWL